MYVEVKNSDLSEGLGVDRVNGLSQQLPDCLLPVSVHIFNYHVGNADGDATQRRRWLAAILDCELGLVQVPPTFRLEILTLGNISG